MLRRALISAAAATTLAGGAYLAAPVLGIAANVTVEDADVWLGKAYPYERDAGVHDCSAWCFWRKMPAFEVRVYGEATEEACTAALDAGCSAQAVADELAQVAP